MYFIANWKMFGTLSSINSINNVIKLVKLKKFRKLRIVYCPPYTLLDAFVKKTKNSKISVGAQNCHYKSDYGASTSFVNAKMIKDLGSEYVIIGHSETRMEGDSDKKINLKIKSALDSNLKVIFCIGETLKNKLNKKTNQILISQIKKGLKNINKYENLLIAYEPVWSIGTGMVPKIKELEKNLNIIRRNLDRLRHGKRIKILYGGSVNSNNIADLTKISKINGFIVGGSSLKSKNFIDIIKKSIN